MLPNSQIGRIASKELTLFFASPVAYLFLAVFSALTLFAFFWGEAFFSRNISDVRPMFEWMPVFLIFLACALSMRMWSEERRSGTLEYVLTQPVPVWKFVIGKFLSCVALLTIALLMTLPLPITVALIGNLDWGPVIAGYFAAFLLGSVYLSAGLFVSARSDNQIVSLILSIILCGALYLIGSPVITKFFGNDLGEWLRLLGTGSRFEAITRGVIDLRDIYYYISVIALFLTLNVYSLERERWATLGNREYHNAWRAFTALLIANALGVNLWLGQISLLRIDATEGRIYSISDATRGYLGELKEPLLIRGYFSSKTHSLLAPLVPQMRDLIREYEVAGDGRVRIEFIDPITNPEMENEANQKYSINAVPFQVSNRYQTALVNSYFNLLIQYGDEYKTLGFNDLIEVKAGNETDILVQLRNPEYDITRTIKQIVESYQAGGNLFDTVQDELIFTAYISRDEDLPPQLVSLKNLIVEELGKTASTAQGHLKIQIKNPDANDGKIALQIKEDYGFKPMATSLLDSNRFFFYMTLSQGKQVVQIPMGDMKIASFRHSLKSAIKRFTRGFTKTLALSVPKPNSQLARYGVDKGNFTELETFLGQNHKVYREDLSDGHIDPEADILVLAAPRELERKQLFAVDQFLMRGGTVIAATSPFTYKLTKQGLTLHDYNSGITQWLQHHGFYIDKQLVVDPQNSAIPIPVKRKVGKLSFQDIKMLDYPYFVDVRGAGLNQKNTITADLPQVSVPWVSPIQVDADKNADRTIIELMHSSRDSWLSDSTDIMPRLNTDNANSLQPQGKQGEQLLAVISQGRFTSYFSGENTTPRINQADNAQNNGPYPDYLDNVMELSPESARIILFSSNDFLHDKVMHMTGTSRGAKYLDSLQLIGNAVDWSLEDRNLLGIKSRGHFNRTLPSLKHTEQLFLEYLNYGLALLLLGIIALQQYLRKRRTKKRYMELLPN